MLNTDNNQFCLKIDQNHIWYYKPDSLIKLDENYLNANS